MALSSPAGNRFVISRTKFLFIACLIAIWTLTGLFPRYQGTIAEQLARTRQRLPSMKLDSHQPSDPVSYYDTGKIALLIEGRAKPHLVPQILHMITVVPPEWRFLFIGSDKSVAAIGRSPAIQYQLDAGKLELMVVPSPWTVRGKEQIWRMLTDKSFYEEILPDAKWIMKFESDSIMCSNSPDSLNDWLRYDWAAAPRHPTDPFAGNGGLSVRRVSAIMRVLSFQSRQHDSEPEDEWFGKRLGGMPDIKVASALDTLHFSVEEVYHEKPLGYHLRAGAGKLPEGVWKSNAQRQKILKYCPEIAIILPMKLERERCAGDNRKGTIDSKITIAKEKAEAERSRKKIEEKKKAAAKEAARKKEEERKKQQDIEVAKGKAQEAKLAGLPEE